MPISVPNYDVNQRAQTAAQAKYGAQEAQINRAVESAKMQEAAQKAALDQYGVAGRQAIESTYNDLYSNLEANRADTNTQLGTQADIIGRGFRDATDIANAARQQSSDRLSQLAKGLGFSGEQTAETLSPIEQLANRIIGQNAQYDATRTGNLRNWAAQQNALMQAGIASARKQGAERRSSFENELVQALADLQARSMNQQFNLQGSLLDLLGEKGAFTSSQADNYLSELFGQQLQAAQYNLGEQEAQSQAAARAAAQALQERELAMRENQYNQSRQDNALEQMLALSREARAGRESDVDMALKQAQLSKMFDPQSLNEWARQNNVDDTTLNMLLDEYDRAANQIAIANATDFSLLSPTKDAAQIASLQKFLGANPASVVRDRLSQGIASNVNFMGPVANRTAGLTPAQIREALSYLGSK